MERFCRECGHEVAEGVQFCKNCGAKLDKNTQRKHSTEKSSGIKGNTSKKKWWVSIVGVVVLCVIAFALWGTSHYSSERAIERFESAVAEGDTETVEELVTVEGEEILNEEAQAIISLADYGDGFTYEEERTPQVLFEDFPVFHVEENDRNALLFFTDYHIAAEPQYIHVASATGGVDTTFNGETFPETESESHDMAYGPMSPGLYEVVSVYETAFGAVDSGSEVELVNGTNEYQTSLDVSDTNLTLSNKHQLPHESMELLVNGERIEMDEGEEEIALGHIPVDGAVELSGTVETAWGDIELDPVAITEPEQEVEIDLMNDELEASLSDVVISFSEDLVNALAEQDANVIEGLPPALQEEFNDEWFDAKDDMGFSGELDEVGINFDELSKNNAERSDDIYELPIHIALTGQFEADDEDEQHENDFFIQLKYEQTDDEWTVHGLDNNVLGTENQYTSYEGSGERVEGVENNEDETNGEESEITDLIEDYVYDLAEAVNEGDYGLVSDNIDPESDFATTQADLVDRQFDNDLTQTVESVSVEDVDEVTDEEWEVEATEVIELEYASGDTENETYHWVYTVEFIDGEYLVTGLE